MDPVHNQPNINRALNLISQAANILTSASPTASPTTTFGNKSLGPLPISTTPVQSTPTSSSVVLPRVLPSFNSTHNQRTPTGSTTVIAELRRNFEPYRRPTGRGGRNVGRPTVSARGGGAPWSHRFYCLGGPTDTCTPSRERQVFLGARQLGHDHIFSDRNGTKESVIQSLEEAFPPIRGIPFEMLQAVGVGGGTGKSLRRLSSQHKVLSVPMILQSRILAIIYIRPDTNIVEEEEPDLNDGNVPFENSIEGDLRAYEGIGDEIEGREITAPSDSAVASTSRTSLPTTDSAYYPELAGMNELRESLYVEHPGEQLVAVQRDDFVSQVLGVYKNPSFNLLKKPMVVFIGEAGRDVGALTKEYFWRGMTEIANGKICTLPLFEGEADHKVPSCDAVLLRSGKFKEVGKFICHAALHCGIGFIGLSWAVVEYLCAKEICSDTVLSMGINDLPEIEIRNVIEKIESWRLTQTAPATSEISAIAAIAMEAGFYLDICFQNLSSLREHIMYYHVIEKRKAQLDSMKEGLRGTPLIQFLEERPHLYANVFPRSTSVEVPLQFVQLEIIGDSEDNKMKEFFASFITSAYEGGHILDLLSCWTGWPLLPDGTLRVKVLPDCSFMVRSCFSEIEVPRNIEMPELTNLMQVALQYASAGFGST